MVLFNVQLDDGGCDWFSHFVFIFARLQTYSWLFLRNKNYIEYLEIIYILITSIKV